MDTLPAKLAFSVDEAGDLLGLSRATLYEEIKYGRLKPFKVGKRTLFSRSSLNQYITDREAEANPQAAA